MKMINLGQYIKFKIFLNRAYRAMILFNIASPLVISSKTNTEIILSLQLFIDSKILNIMPHLYKHSKFEIDPKFGEWKSKMNFSSTFSWTKSYN